MNMNVALLEKQGCLAINCEGIERLIRAYARPRLSDDLKENIIKKRNVMERLHFMKCFHDKWAWVGHWGAGDDGLEVSWIEYLCFNMTTEEIQTTFKILTKCGCCERHEDLNGINKTNYNYNCKRCSCNCRHYARWMRRVLEFEGGKIPNMYDHADTEEVDNLRNWEQVNNDIDAEFVQR
jgi:hypothetical protein